MFDYDNDGWLDLLMVNGSVTLIEEQARKGSLYPLAQSNLLFHNNGKGQFENVTSHAGAAFSLWKWGGVRRLGTSTMMEISMS